MLNSARLGMEISAKVANKIGALAGMTKVLADSGINIVAIVGYALPGNEAEIMLVTKDNPKAVEVLKKNNYTSLQEQEVLIVELENKTGALKEISARLASGNVDIKYIYGTTCSCAGPAMIVLSTSDNKKALAVCGA